MSKQNKKVFSIQDTIVKEMKDQGYTYKSFAQAIGCTPKAIVLWKNHERAMSLETADTALKELGITISIGKEETRQ